MSKQLEKDLNELYDNCKIRIGQQLIIVLTNPDGSYFVRGNCDKETLKKNLINTADNLTK